MLRDLDVSYGLAKSNAMHSETGKTFTDVDTLTAFFIFMFKKIKFI